MRILYVFPHPDDESFGPAAAMHQQLRLGQEVHLLTLTKGGATKERHKFNYSVEEMGEVRHKEMVEVEKTLNLTSFKILDLPDSGLKQLDPREIAQPIQAHIEQLRPDVVVSYPVHGISGFHDHLITHAVVKRLYLDMKDKGADYLKRLAFFTLPDSEGPKVAAMDFTLKKSAEDDIDVEVELAKEDIEAMKRALTCYKTYQDKIEELGVVELIGDKVYYEIFGEEYSPRLTALTQGL
jgi:LmbE family N-acetylglucosaminyl deacetylase